MSLDQCNPQPVLYYISVIGFIIPHGVTGDVSPVSSRELFKGGNDVLHQRQVWSVTFGLPRTSETTLR